VQEGGKEYTFRVLTQAAVQIEIGMVRILASLTPQLWTEKALFSPAAVQFRIRFSLV
jgi:hypothetical protein